MSLKWRKKQVVVSQEPEKEGGGLLYQDDGSVKGGTVSKLVAVITNEGGSGKRLFDR